MRMTFLLVALACAVPSCTPVELPEHHLSAAAYDRKAAAERAEAERQQQAYRPNAGSHRSTCEGKSDLAGVCWTSVGNPTEGHRVEAERLRRQAARDRALSRELREAEARSCRGVSDDDRDEGPFVHDEDIEAVAALYSPSRPGADARLLGAVVTFRPVWGLTVEFLRRVVDCHLARIDVLGHRLPDAPDSPLATPGTRATVTRTAEGFAIALSNDDPVEAQELLRRARLLVTGSSGRPADR